MKGKSLVAIFYLPLLILAFLWAFLRLSFSLTIGFVYTTGNDLYYTWMAHINKNLKKE